MGDISWIGIVINVLFSAMAAFAGAVIGRIWDRRHDKP